MTEVDVYSSLLSKKIEKALDEKKGLLIGRYGTIEFECLWHWNRGTIPREYTLVLEKNAGIFPIDSKSILAWCHEYKEAILSADTLATGWYPPILNKEKILKEWGYTGETVVLRSLEPYYASPEYRWTKVLKGLSICVVSSFAETAESQVAKSIWASPVLPENAVWSWVKTGYAPSMALGNAGWEDITSWQEAVDYVIKEVLKTEARIVLIGCGGLGMIIAARLKALGKICIVMGGAIQVLFGIKGKRWESHSIISKFWNDAWVYPSSTEIPGNAKEVEGGCYWL